MPEDQATAEPVPTEQQLAANLKKALSARRQSPQAFNQAFDEMFPIQNSPAAPPPGSSPSPRPKPQPHPVPERA